MDVTGSLLAPAVYMAVLSVCVFLVALRLPESYKSSLLHEEDHEPVASDDVPERTDSTLKPAPVTAETVTDERQHADGVLRPTDHTRRR